MNKLLKLIPSDELSLIKIEDIKWLTSVFNKYTGYPNVEQIWELMNQPWDTLKCDPTVMDERIEKYYSHPVWLLNGLFIEQHLPSLKNRIDFKDWVTKQSPTKIAELGGGFGSLARMIALDLPLCFIDVVEPHAHPIALARANKTNNVRYVNYMEDTYDILIATDVFEHVPDPIKLVYETAQHLTVGGRYLIANCFHPIIHCHLPQTFHLRYSWDETMLAMGLVPADKVSYGRAYVKQDDLDLDAARKVEFKSQKLWQYTKHLPNIAGRIFTKIFLS